MTSASLLLMGLWCVSPAWADEAAVRAVAQKLPAQLAALYKAQEEKFAGSTMDMIAAADAVSSGILPALVALEMDGKSKAEKTTFQKEIERDAEGSRMKFITAPMPQDPAGPLWGSKPPRPKQVISKPGSAMR